MNEITIHIQMDGKESATIISEAMDDVILQTMDESHGELI